MKFLVNEKGAIGKILRVSFFNDNLIHVTHGVPERFGGESDFRVDIRLGLCCSRQRADRLDQYVCNVKIKTGCANYFDVFNGEHSSLLLKSWRIENFQDWSAVLTQQFLTSGSKCWMLLCA